MSRSETPFSLAERIRDDPEYRDAYYNSTSVHLFADPENEETNRILDTLQRCSLAYLFTEDEFLPRPMIQTQFGQFVGEGEINRAITRLVIPDVFGKAEQQLMQ